MNAKNLLSSHTTKVDRSASPNRFPERGSDVNTVETYTSIVVREVQSQSLSCSGDKICDVIPLDNLLTVSELEFNQQMKLGDWNKTNKEDIVSSDVVDSFDTFSKMRSI